MALGYQGSATCTHRRLLHAEDVGEVLLAWVVLEPRHAGGLVEAVQRVARPGPLQRVHALPAAL